MEVIAEFLKVFVAVTTAVMRPAADDDHQFVGSPRLALPRLLFPTCLALLFMASLPGQRSPMAWSAGLCLGVMSLLFLAVGYRDEFRATGIGLPFVLVALAWLPGQRRAPGLSRDMP